MTNEEAKEVLKEQIDRYGQEYDSEGIEALNMAIQALEQQPMDADCISREATKEMLIEEWTKHIPMELDINLSFVLGKINELPSVTPQPKIGYWEYVQYDSNPNIGNWHCSECRSICTEMHSIEDSYNYCPNCGAKMEVEE